MSAKQVVVRTVPIRAFNFIAKFYEKKKKRLLLIANCSEN